MPDQDGSVASMKIDGRERGLGQQGVENVDHWTTFELPAETCGPMQIHSVLSSKCDKKTSHNVRGTGNTLVLPSIQINTNDHANASEPLTTWVYEGFAAAGAEVSGFVDVGAV